MISKVFEDMMSGAMNAATTEGLKDAQIMSQGPMSLGALAKADHPLARRHGMPLLPPEIINEQSGDFLRDWYRDPAEIFLQSIHGAIINENPIADYLTQPYGAPKTTMFQRPIDTVVERKLGVHLENEINKAIDRFESTDFVINL